MRNESSRLRLLILTVLIVIGIVASAWALGRTGDWEGLALNMGSELVGAAFTFLLLDLILARREQRETEQAQITQQRADLLGRMSSEVNNVARAAADEVRRRGWLTNGTLEGVELRRADLSNADLSSSRLQKANLHRAKLNDADLREADLSDTDLSGAWLQKARLWDANLTGTNLWQARLHNADLRRARLNDARLNECRFHEADLRDCKFNNALLADARLNNARLQGADLTGADLSRAMLDAVECSIATVLPDGNPWGPATDWRRFTDPAHPQFWRSPLAEDTDSMT